MRASGCGSEIPSLASAGGEAVDPSPSACRKQSSGPRPSQAEPGSPRSRELGTGDEAATSQARLSWWSSVLLETLAVCWWWEDRPMRETSYVGLIISPRASSGPSHYDASGNGS